jgi:hypothetical protein
MDDLTLKNSRLLETLKLLEQNNNDENLSNKANDLAYEYVYNEHFNKYINNFIIEKTPIGNVLMFYDNKKKAFQYYTDNTIPYKYLEVVARKYVKTFKCRCLYINMEDEMKIVTTKVVENNSIIPNKKDIFAKFKYYNNSSSNHDKSAMIAPPKNNIIKNNITPINKDLILKENTNHYICSGKLSNYNFLKPIKSEFINKKKSVTYSDFKNLKNCK